MESVKAKLKKEKLEHYAKRELQDFYQTDVWTEQLGDCVFSPDEDGVCIMGGVTRELMNGPDTVRILVKRGASKEKVLLALRKAMSVFESSSIAGLDWLDWHEQEAKRMDMVDAAGGPDERRRLAEGFYIKDFEQGWEIEPAFRGAEAQMLKDIVNKVDV